MRHVRPHQVFHLVESGQRRFTQLLPTRDSAMSLLETALLVALLKAVRPEKVFEFGTYLGETTQILAANLPSPTAHVYTLDIEGLEGVAFEGRDRVIAEKATSARSAAGRNEFLQNQITQLIGDSLQFEPSNLIGQVAYVLVDANHSLRYVKKDTENALKMLSADPPSCIIWHDYGNPNHEALTSYLEQLSSELRLYHVEETMLAVHVRGEALQLA